MRNALIVARREVVMALSRRGFLAATVLLLAGAAVALLQVDPQRPVVLTPIGAGFAAGVLICLTLLTSGLTLAQGVVEEKGSRVVEILLSTVRPWELLAGKVLGVGLSGLVQNALCVGGVLAVGAATGRLQVDGALLGTAAWAAVWYVLGFGLYATLLAAAASTVSRQEEVASAVQPVLFVLFAPYVAGLYLINDDPTGPLAEVLSLVPVLSPFLAPVRIAAGTMPLGQILLAAALTVGATALAGRLAGRVYRQSVLRTGARVPLRRALGLA